MVRLRLGPRRSTLLAPRGASHPQPRKLTYASLRKTTCHHRVIYNSMKQLLRLGAISLVIALSCVPHGVSQTPAGSSILTIPTNFPNVRTFVPPSATFNPLVASPEALRQHGFPPMPDHRKAPAAYNAWARAMSVPHRRLQSPQLVQTRIFNGPARIQRFRESRARASEFNAPQTNAIATTTPEWRGYVA